MRTLLFERNLARFAASRVLSSLGSGRGAGVGPLRLADCAPPTLPGPDWHPVRPLLSGICGSDLATIDGRSSRYFEEIVSFPFVPGHEVAGVVETPATSATGSVLAAGTRVVLEPVLGCVARGLDPPCPSCAAGDIGDCQRVAHGHLRPGLQTGFCADTGGGWSAAGLVAHRSQLHAVPEGFSDEDAVMVEPVACAAHAALRARIREGDLVAVIGAGTVGLTLTASLAHLVANGRCPSLSALLVGARHAQQGTLALELGATSTFPSDQLARAVRRQSRAFALGSPQTSGQQLTGGADVVFDCVGSAESIRQGLALVRPRGQIVLVGMPGRVSVDLAPLWHREVTLTGSYAYGTERTSDPSVEDAADERRRATLSCRTFDLAMDIVGSLRLGRLVSATYPLERFEEALAHAGGAGRRGAVKICFDLREDHSRANRPRAKGRLS